MHALCAPLALATGCLMAGNYHTAKTLDKGLSQTGLTFSATRYEKTQTDGNGNTTTVAAAIPNILPELTYHLGVADNLEAGGRVSLGALGGELDLKYRFLHNDKLHLAVAPAVSYQAFVVIEGVGVRLPGILTYELSDMLDFNAAAFVSQSHWTTAGSNSSDFSTFKGDLTATGAAIGFDLHGETLSIRPSVEFTRYVANVGNSGTFDPFNTVNFLVHIAWTGAVCAGARARAVCAGARARAVSPGAGARAGCAAPDVTRVSAPPLGWWRDRTDRGWSPSPTP
jgi:hypothetical protein